MSEIEIRPYESGDEHSILEAWNLVFPAQDKLPERDLAHWTWQYRTNPLGRSEIICAVVDAKVVAQYACVPLAAVDEGQDITIGCVCDAFVLPEYRRAGQRPGLIIHVAERLHRAYCGRDAELITPGHSLLYGYPFPIWRVAQRYLSSEMVRDMDILFRELRAGGYRPSPAPEAVLVEESAGSADFADFGRAADELWQQLRDSVRFGLVRDRAWFDWRYARHPAHQYRILLARSKSDGKARGIAVYRKGKYVVEDAGILCDWLCPADDEEAEQALICAVEECARDDGVHSLLAVFPQNDPRFSSFQRRGFLVGPPSHFLVMNSFKHHVLYLRERWYFTLGDSDLV